MKKEKIFFILSSLRTGGSERVFYLLASNFDRSLYDISLILLDSTNNFFPLPIKGVKTIDLETQKASKSIWKLIKLFIKEKPDAVFSTGSHINVLIALISFFVKPKTLIARESNIPNLMKVYGGIKGRVTADLIKRLYYRFDIIVCQSLEMEVALKNVFNISTNKLVVIPNPLINSDIIKTNPASAIKRLIIVARLSAEKGHERLLNIMKNLPPNYHLTIVGDGPLKADLKEKIVDYKLVERIHLTGQIENVLETVAKHDLFVLSSYTEGFPNAVIESLSVGIPVISFEVGGIRQIINHGNGYIVDQDDTETFIKYIIEAGERDWKADEIKQDVLNRYGMDVIINRYSNLIGENNYIN